MKTYISLLFLLLTSTLCFSQNYVNKYVLSPFGNPVPDIDWSESATNGDGDIITVGNTVIDSDNVALYVIKQNSAGEILWQNYWTNSSFSDSKSYGIVLSIDTNDNIIVVGATTPDTEFNSDIVALKYTSSGILLWSSLLQGNNSSTDVPAAVVTNSIGNIYITGLTYSVSNQADFYTCKLDGDTGNLLWSETEDNNGGNDVAMNIRLNMNEHPIISGVSSTDNSNWNVKMMKYASANGAIQNQVTLVDSIVNSSLFIVDLKIDNYGNFYLLGKANGNGSDVRLTKLTADLEEEWSVTYDLSGNIDEAVSISIRNDDLIIVTASSQNSYQNYELITLAYKPNGVLHWQNSRSPSTSGEDVKGVRSTVSAAGDIYIVGEIQNGANSEIVIIKYSFEGEKLWEKRHGDGHDYATGINHVGNKLFVSAKSINGLEVKYYTLRLEEYIKDNPIVYDQYTGRPIYKANELIVKFDSKKLIVENIDNLDLIFGSPDLWLTEQAALEIDQHINIKRANFIRIFKTLKSTHQSSISRLNETIPIPEFYATFLVDFPNGTNLDSVTSSLELLFPTIKYTHKNYLSIPSGALDVPNDPLYVDQKSLQNPNSSVENSINIEPFWAEETGKPYIRIGVLDNGLELEHEDFILDDQTSVAVGGWDYQASVPLSSLSADDQDESGHGTSSAGIIGAIRNNELGIAGIAGGFSNGSTDLSDRGVSLYGLKYFGNPFDIESQADAIATSVIDNPSIEGAFGVHVLNAGYNFPAPTLNDNEAYLVSEAIRFANRNKVSFMNSSGNFGTQNLNEVICSYPSCFDGDWVTVVSGTGTDGNYKVFDNGSPDDFWPNRGNYVDIAAPCVTQLVWTIQGMDLPGTYTEWSGTSAAVCHASGVAGLLLSYLNTPLPSYGNLAPEDIEFILKETASPTNAPSFPTPNILTGYGRLNAGASFDLVEDPFRRLVHFGTDNDFNTKSSILVQSDITFDLTEPYDNSVGESFAPATYTADVYKISATVDHTISPTDIILHSWERHSSSTLFPLAVDGGNLIPHEKVNLVSFTNTQGILEGYVYELKDANGNSLGWIPFEVGCSFL